MENHASRLGVIVPPGNISIEREFLAYAPAGIGLHFNRLSRPVSVSSAESILSMHASLERTAMDLAQCDPDLILFGCTSASFLKGGDSFENVSDFIREKTSIRSISTSEAVIAAFRRLDIRTCFLLTPYPDEVNQGAVDYLGRHGIKCTGVDTFNCPHTDITRAITTNQVVERALGNGKTIKDAGALFISCTNLLSMEGIGCIEAELGVPVVSSNQATLFAGLDAINCKTPPLGVGRLFSTIS